MGYILKTGIDPAGFSIERSTGEPVEDANRFLQTLWARSLSPHTIRTYGYGLVVLHRWLETTKRTIAALSIEDLTEWVIEQRERGANAHTINHRLLTCRLFYRYLLDRELPVIPGTGLGASRPGICLVSPHLGIVRFQGTQGARALRVRPAHRLIEPLSAAQVNAFLGNTARYRDLAIVLLMLLTGLRSNEALLLRIGDLDFAEGRVRVHGKGNRERMLPLPEASIAALRKYLHLERPPESGSDRVFVVLQGSRRGQPMTAAGLRSLFRARRRSKASLRPANPHRFRHTFGADMARSGVRLPVLQRMMGHASGLTTLRYINLSVTDIADEYNRAMERICKRYGPGLP